MDTKRIYGGTAGLSYDPRVCTGCEHYGFIHPVGYGTCPGNWYAPSARLPGVEKEDCDEKGQGPLTSPLGSLGGLQRESGAESGVLQERWLFSRVRDLNGTRGTVGPELRPRCYPPRRYSPSPVGRAFSDDDEEPSGAELGLSEIESESEDCSEHTSDREFLMESDDLYSGEVNDTMGEPGNREDVFCSGSATEGSGSESSGRSVNVRSISSRRHHIRRRLNPASSEDGSDTLGGSGSAKVNPLSVPHGLYSEKHAEDMDYERVRGCLHASPRCSDCEKSRSDPIEIAPNWGTPSHRRGCAGWGLDTAELCTPGCFY